VVVGGGRAGMSGIGVLVAPGALIAGTTLSLDGDELHHLRVRRVRSGDTVMVYDGAGASAAGVYSSDGVAVHGAVERTAAPSLRVLAVGAGDKERFLQLAGRCTELGVTDLVPLVTERTLAVASRYRDTARERAERAAREACKQSGNAWATRIAPACDLSKVDKTWPGLRWWIADQHGAAPPDMAVDGPVGCLVGPEGGWTPAELAHAAESLHATPVRLAAAVLRFETAALAAATLLHDRQDG
jgi:16S rRNA (uracil1498-N3)-methyltransferase